MSETWYTKEDAVRDLALVTGSNVSDYDNCYFVRGERPPPPVCIDDEAEKELQNLQFFGGADGIIRNKDETMEPDLKGISQMIQMVKEYDDDTTSTPTEELQETVVVISKLNPNVEEFVPKSSVSNTSNEKNSVVAKDNNCDSNNTTNNTINPVSTENMDGILKESAKITSNGLNGKNELDREQLYDAQLKNKIINASVSKTLKNKREKNVAIAALLKLHTRPTSSSPQTVVSTPLLPPQYFEKSYFNSVNTDDVQSVKKTNGMSTTSPFKLQREFLKSESSISNFSNTGDKIEKEHSNSENEPRTVTRDTVQSTNKEECRLNRENEVKEDTRAVEESINKVKRWLNKPNSSKLKPPVLQAGQVTYFKKNKTMSPCPDTPEDVRSTSSSVASHYVPSQYADDLCKKYMNQSKKRDERRDDMWTKLERELKERDERIKNSSKQSTTAPSSNNLNDL